MNLHDWADRAERNFAWVRRATWCVLVLGLAACSVRGADRPADPVLVEGSAPRPDGSTRVPITGFDEVAFRITTEAGEELEWCALLAATEAARAQGLMERNDLAGYDAMVFRFQEPTTGAFYMFHTVMPLSIAWFAEDGSYVSQTDMPPCPAGEAKDCPTYPPEGPYLHAIEVQQGKLGDLGITPGATLTFPGGRCA